MSIEAMDRVWKTSKLKGSALLCLLAIADNAGTDNTCYPGVPYLAKKTRMSERQVQRLIQYLDTTDELAIEWNGGRGNSHLYHVLTGLPADKCRAIKIRVSQINEERGVTLENQRKGDKMSPVKGDKMSPGKSEKGDILTPEPPVKGDKNSVKGDIAMSPEPLNRLNPQGTERVYLTEIWTLTLGQIRGELTRGDYQSYLEPCVPDRLEDGTLVVRIANGYARDWINSRCGARLNRIVSGIVQQQVQVRVEVGVVS